MARYKRPSIRLVLAAEEFDGLEIDVRRLSNDQMLDIMDSAMRMDDVDQTSADQMRKALRELAEALVPAIVRWNLDDEHDLPVPLTTDGLYGQDPGLLVAIADGVQQALAGVSDFLPPSSGDGPRSLAELAETE